MGHLDEARPSDPNRQTRGPRRCLPGRTRAPAGGGAFWLIIKRHNQRLYRVAHAILDDHAEAEDVLQETYIRAFTHLSEFRS